MQVTGSCNCPTTSRSFAPLGAQITTTVYFRWGGEGWFYGQLVFCVADMAGFGSALTYDTDTHDYDSPIILNFDQNRDNIQVGLGFPSFSSVTVHINPPSGMTVSPNVITFGSGQGYVTVYVATGPPGQAWFDQPLTISLTSSDFVYNGNVNNGVLVTISDCLPQYWEPPEQPLPCPCSVFDPGCPDSCGGSQNCGTTILNCNCWQCGVRFRCFAFLLCCCFHVCGLRRLLQRWLFDHQPRDL